MCNLTAKDFPAPPPYKSGWPWTDPNPKPMELKQDSIAWPTISIVTPSLNQAPYIEETIRSVLLQGYPRLEYIIIDGGSSDGSIDIIKKYEKWLTYWVSEPDSGQSHAINKGFSLASGEIFGYINSDDLYEPDSFSAVATKFLQTNIPFLVAGVCLVFENDKVKRVFRPYWPNDLSYFLSKTYSSTFAQPASFWDRKSFIQIGGFDETLNYCLDREFFLRFGHLGVEPLFIESALARFREHPNSKTISNSKKFHEESIRILEKHSRICGISRWKEIKWKKRMENEIKYGEVFIKWKEEGRIKAIEYFIKMILKTPWLIFEWKIIGQARRLFACKENSVQELADSKVK